jgi:hypothetical protein
MIRKRSKKEPKKKGPKTLSELKKEIDRVFSIYIRLRDRGICFTCSKYYGFKKTQCGHFVSRSHMNTRYDEKNCHAQCIGCNIFKSGNMVIYAIKMVQKYGQGIVEEMQKRANKIRKWTPKEMEVQIEIYKKKIEAML